VIRARLGLGLAVFDMLAPPAPFGDRAIDLPTVLPAALLLACLSVFLMARVVGTLRGKPITGSEGMVGELGEAVGPLEPEGKVFVHGEYWDAVASSFLPRGARVRVVKVSGGRLQVEDARLPPPSD
jgi:membrane-bound serine protease (ClpP class)